MWGQPGEVFFIRYVSSVRSETDESNLTCALDMFHLKAVNLQEVTKRQKNAVDQ
jgi:hypothetical protein